MKRFSEQFHNKAQSVKLQAVERAELRNRVVSYMEYHPLPGNLKQVVSEKGESAIPEQFPFVQIPFSVIMKWSAAVAAVVLVVVPFLAERAIPGDSLYAVKVRFNEEFVSTLKLSPYEKVEWETERLNRRIAEARLLANEGKLTDEVEAEIAAAVKEHTENVKEEIEVLRADDADQATLAAIELSTTLETQSEAFKEEGNTILAAAVTDAVENPAQMVVDAINEGLEQQGLQSESAALPPYDKIMARVEINTTRAYELIQSLKLNSEDKIRKDAERRLEDVSRAIQKAQSLKGENEAQASEQLLDALQRTKKIIVFLSDAGVNQTTDIESIIPIEYTDEEYRGQLTILQEDINRKQEIIKVLSPQVSVAAAEKAAYAVTISESNNAIIASSTEPESAVHLARESVAVLQDAIVLFESEGVSVRTSPPEPALEQGTTTEEVIEETNVSEVTPAQQ